MVRRTDEANWNWAPSLSNARGDFFLAPLPDGLHSLVVRRAGYETATAEKIAVENGYYTMVAVKLRRGGAPVPAWLPLTPPELIAGPPLQYPQRPVEGTVLVRCTITVAGSVVDCIANQNIPELAPILRALEGRRYRPAMRNGSPIEVGYTYRITFAYSN